MKASLRTSLATLVGSVTLLVAPAAFAVGEMCFNDTDCPNPACGGDVCDWGTKHPMGTDALPYTCVAAGTDPKGQDGWCSNTTTHEHCKCKDLGAQCKTVYCTFTKPDQAPPGAGTGGTGAGGTGAVTAGTTSAAGTATTAGTGTTSKPPAEEGGCSVSAPGGTNTGVALGVGLLGLGLAFARRRRA
jgi:MYXO-CTERM domain-containing protein